MYLWFVWIRLFLDKGAPKDLETTFVWFDSEEDLFNSEESPQRSTYIPLYHIYYIFNFSLSSQHPSIFLFIFLWQLRIFFISSFICIFTFICFSIGLTGLPPWPPYICHTTRNWVGDQKTLQNISIFAAHTHQNAQKNYQNIIFLFKQIFTNYKCTGKTQCLHPYRQSRR